MGFYKSHDKLDIFLRRTRSRDLTQLMFSSSPSMWSNMTVRQVVRVKIPNLTHFYGCEIFHNRTAKCVTLDILTLTPRVTIIPSFLFLFLILLFHGTLNFVNVWCTFYLFNAFWVYTGGVDLLLFFFFYR